MGFVRQETQDIQDADLQTVSRKDEAANNASLARVDETPKEEDNDFRNFQENFGAFLDAVIATIALIFRCWAGDVDVVGVVPVALDRVEDVLRGSVGLFLDSWLIIAKLDVLEFENLHHVV